jgi:3-dehydroquinate synthase
MKTLNVSLGNFGYPIHLEENLLYKAGELCRGLGIGNRVAVITDSTVKNLYLNRVQDSLLGQGFDVHSMDIKPGEQSKSMPVVESVYDELIGRRFERSSAVIALGGGVVGDLAGFVAATLLRGIHYVQIPTTLIAQTDSSIGGKVGINHRLGKNLIGAFYQPKLVLIDPLVLGTLAHREWVAGMGEVIKYGVIRDTEFFAMLEKNIEGILKFENMPLIEDMVLRCCEIKAQVVSEDEKEQNVRRILNFGHTIVHVFESATGYGRFLHGEAVLLGMIAAGWLSKKYEGFSNEEFQRLESLIKKTRLSPDFTGITDDMLLDTITRDKKVKQGKVNFVLAKRFGETVIRADIQQEDVIGAFHYVQEAFK